MRSMFTNWEMCWTPKVTKVGSIPYEWQIFCVDTPEGFHPLNPHHARNNDPMIERLAEQIATVCSELGEDPSVRYRSGHGICESVAKQVESALTKCRANNPTMGQGFRKHYTQLILVDRGFDPVSPLLHELTYQAMLYDVLPIEKNIYRYGAESDENDDMWLALRHCHIAKVLKKVSKKLKRFIVENKKATTGEKINLKELAQMVKGLPQKRKELKRYTTHMELAEDCLKAFENGMNKLCELEQDLAMGTYNTNNGEVLKNIISFMFEDTILVYDKLRILILYIIAENGISEKNLDELLKDGHITGTERTIVTNMNYLGVSVIYDPNAAEQKENTAKRKVHIRHSTYKLSRWIPTIKNIIEDACIDQLDEQNYPYLENKALRLPGYGVTSPTGTRSKRYGFWSKDRSKLDYKNKPKLIVFVIGGISYSEMRSVYELATEEEYAKWDIYLGSTNIFTPEEFLKDLLNLNSS